MIFSLLNMMLFGPLFAVMPASGTYQLNNYGFGSGGANNSTSANFSLNGTSGQTTSSDSSSANFKVRSGRINVQQSSVPIAPTFTNPANYYNKLRVIISPSSNPSDTKFSIAISTDNFASTQYVQSDNTVGPVRGIEDYQTYATWGGGTGQLIVGLSPSTTYKIKVNAFQGSYTETEFGPVATAATVAPSITFDVDVAATDIDTSPPYATAFSSLLPASVVNSNEKIWIDLDTNAEAGAKVYVTSGNSGLRSTVTGFTLSSASADLAAVATGYGAQGSTATQASGGPLSISAPYNVAAQNVGILNTTIREIFSSSVPVTAGRGSLQLKARAAATTPAAPDYQDTLTLTAAASF